jgi:protease-4
LATIIGLFIFLCCSFRDTNCQGQFGGDSEAITVKNNSVIVLNLEDIKYDCGKYEDHGSLFLQIKKNVGLTDVIKAIEDAKTDDDIKGYLY